MMALLRAACGCRRGALPNCGVESELTREDESVDRVTTPQASASTLGGADRGGGGISYALSLAQDYSFLLAREASSSSTLNAMKVRGEGVIEGGALGTSAIRFCIPKQFIFVSFLRPLL